MHMLEPTPSHTTDCGSLHRRLPLAGSATEALPDLLLIERARAADERAVETLIRRYCRRLYRVAFSILLDEERAAAAVLHAYLGAFADLNRYEPTGKFAAWLTRLAHSQARAQQAAAGRVATAAEAADRSERAALEQAIAALPEVFRTVYVLRMVEGISGIETAACLGLHETTVRTRLFRGHRRLPADVPQRLRSVPGVMELPPARLEQIVGCALGQLPHEAVVTLSAGAP
jgi:RNA polymerase sigma-70 factor, ECF subfamily